MLSPFCANSTDEDILREKIENDELYRLDCVNRPYTGVLINQIKQEDAEITSLRSAASLIGEVKPRFPRNIKPLMLGPILTNEVPYVIASAEITLIRKKRKIRIKGEHFKLINISRQF